MSARGKLALRKLLRDIIRAGRGKVARGRGLHGGLNEKTSAVTKSQNYLAELKLGGNGRDWGANPDLDRFIGDLRQTAGNFRLGASARLKAVERLLRIEGLATPTIYAEPIDRLLESLTNSGGGPVTEPLADESLEAMLERIRAQGGNDG